MSTDLPPDELKAFRRPSPSLRSALGTAACGVLASAAAMVVAWSLPTAGVVEAEARGAVGSGEYVGLRACSLSPEARATLSWPATIGAAVVLLGAAASIAHRRITMVRLGLLVAFGGVALVGLLARVDREGEAREALARCERKAEEARAELKRQLERERQHRLYKLDRLFERMLAGERSAEAEWSAVVEELPAHRTALEAVLREVRGVWGARSTVDNLIRAAAEPYNAELDMDIHARRAELGEAANEHQGRARRLFRKAMAELEVKGRR